MTMGAREFIESFKSQLRLQGRQVRARAEASWGPGKEDSVYIDFVNLPEGVGGAGGGAEAENNRATFVVHGFGPANMPPPSGKVKVSELKSHLYSGSGAPSRETRVSMRAKTGTPAQVAKYVADFLNKVVQTVEPRFTHTHARMTGERAMATRSKSKKGPYLAKPLAFPELHDFRQLFVVAEPWQGNVNRRGPSEQEQRLSVRLSYPRERGQDCGFMVLGPYMTVSGQKTHRESLAVKPTQSVVDWITVSMIHIDCDHLYFEAIVRSRSEALIVVKYNRILGDRWLALVDPRTIPRFDR